jgi:dUTP pyrophosphatase
MTLYICPTDELSHARMKAQLNGHRYTDSGVDIPVGAYHVPLSVHSHSFSLGVRVAAVDSSNNPMPCILLPRSSIYKTRFRMANSIGLIDAGYRGEVQAKVDVLNYGRPDIDSHPFEDGPDGSRLFQICQHNFLPWKRIVIVPSLTELPTFSDTRGEGGFGSTGNTTSYDSLSSHLHGDGGIGLGYVP